MKRIPVTIINRLGLHARAAAKFVKLAGNFQAEILVHRGGQSVNGKSILGVMMLAASQGTEIELSADGPDEEPALDALQALINDRFQEAQ